MSQVVVAASEEAVQELFTVLRKTLEFSAAKSGDFGPFTASYDVALHFANGAIDLHDDNTVSISELDIKWDRLRLTIGVDIPSFCVGGFCLIPIPFDGCLLRAPRICLFEGDPDFEFPIDLSNVITSEVSISARPVVRYRVDPNRTPQMTDLDAEDAGVPNKWQVFIDPVTVDVDIVDIADTVGDLIEKAFDAFIDGVLGPLPGWAKDLVKAILGPIDDLVRVLLDIGDDIDEWLTDLLGVSLGLFDTIIQFVSDYFANREPILELEDPYKIMEGDPAVPLNPVKIPLRDLGATVNSAELVVTADVGA